MCGIAGVFNASGISKDDISATENAIRSILYRGPDNTTTLSLPEFAAAHTRLSIIDLSSNSNQPFYSDDKRYILLFNGEIFNFRNLKSELQKAGSVFRTRSDTEVLLHLLIRNGVNGINRLEGFFSIAFYDTQKKELLLIRDRFGEKPLYYSRIQNNVYFASELKALMKFSVPKILNKKLLPYYIALTYYPAPFTVYENVFKLEPGEYLHCTNTGFQKRKYYTVAKSKLLENHKDAKDLLRKCLIDSVEKRLIADVPLASFLSGGMDSTIVSGIARQLTGNLKTFSLGFPDHPFFDETNYALEAAKHLKTKHEVIPVTAKELDTALNPVFENLSEPFADSSAIVMYLLCKKVKDHCTVALSGDGADELFGGYNKHRALFRSNSKSLQNTILKNTSSLFNLLPSGRNSKWNNRNRQLAKYSKGLKQSFQERYFSWACWTPLNEVAGLLLEKTDFSLYQSLYDQPEKGDFNSVFLADVQLVLANDMLVKVDSMSMLNSMEVRPPFLDNAVVDLAFRIPAEWKVDSQSGKNILRETFAEYLPESIRNRSKKGFEVPLDHWLKTSLASRIEKEWFDSDFLKQQQVFDPEKIKAKWEQYLRGKSNGSLIWSLIVFQSWWKNNMN